MAGFLYHRGVATFGRERRNGRKRILPTAVLRQLLAIGRVGQRRLVAGLYEIERVIRVACVPETKLFAGTGTTPLVEALRLVVLLGDFGSNRRVRGWRSGRVRWP